jgi:LPXTG-site transpeptidase (sortase) family protein
MRGIDRTKIIIGLCFVVLSIGLYMLEKKNEVYATSFSEEPVQVIGLSTKFYTEEDIPNRIVISDVGIDLPIKKSRVINGYWEVFNDSAGWGEGSGIPGLPGNQVIFAHAKKGLFYAIQEVEKGNLVTIYTANQSYTYQITNIEEVSPNNTNVIAPTDDERVTLYTCSGYKSTKRLLVIAKRVVPDLE